MPALQADAEAQFADRAHGVAEGRLQGRLAAAEDHRLQQALASAEEVEQAWPGDFLPRGAISSGLWQ